MDRSNARDYFYFLVKKGGTMVWGEFSFWEKKSVRKIKNIDSRDLKLKRKNNYLTFFFIEKKKSILK